jgi:hypothetical protein
MQDSGLTLANGMLFGGVALTMLGLLGVIACIVKARSLRSESDAAKVRAAMHGLVALNLGSVGASFMGLGLVVVGLIF